MKTEKGRQIVSKKKEDILDIYYAICWIFVQLAQFWYYFVANFVFKQVKINICTVHDIIKTYKIKSSR